MNEQSPKKEMQQIITNLIETNSTDTIWECIKIYSKTFGMDNFCKSLYEIPSIQPLVSLVCIDVSDGGGQ